MSDKMREAFEKWATIKALDIRMDKDAWGQSRYYHSHIDAMWTAWQAAHAAALPPGFVPVPVEDAKNAERYEWLKKHAHIIEWHPEDEDGRREHDRRSLDADIDRAIGVCNENSN